MITAPSLDESRSPLLTPPDLFLNFLSVVKLGTILSLVTDDDDAHTAPFQVPGGESTDSARTTGTKVNGVGGSGREGGGFRPVNGHGADLIAERPRQGGREVTEIRT